MARGNRVPVWLIALIVAAGVVVTAVLGIWTYLRSVAPLHPDPKQIPFATNVAPSAEWTAAVEKARQVARAAVSDQNLPGLSVAVGVGQELVWAEGFGWADIEKRVVITPAMRVRVGHVSKALTSAGAGLLLEQKRLHLGDEIQTYVPTFPKKPWPITLRQLMGHTSGLRHYRGEEGDIPDGHCVRASDGLRMFANDPLLFEPDTQYKYSTYGWILVSAAIESAAGEPFFSFMRTHVFEPLGMTGTTADSGAEPVPDRVTFYFPRFSGDNAFGHSIATPVDYSCFAGAGGFLSTPSDLVRFGLAMMNGKLLQPNTVRQLQSPQSLRSGQETEYGLGWMLETAQLGGESTRVAGHASRTLVGAATSYLTFPDRGLVVAVTSNTSYAPLKQVALSIAQVFAR